MASPTQLLQMTAMMIPMINLVLWPPQPQHSVNNAIGSCKYTQLCKTYADFENIKEQLVSG